MTNACTRTNATTYNFCVSSAKLKEALDIWSQFFIAPLMSEDAVAREMSAVNSEFEISKKHDGTRLNHVQKEAIIKAGHTLGGFQCGNIQSLKTDLDAKGESAYAYLHQWYPRNYSAEWMYLTLESG